MMTATPMGLVLVVDDDRGTSLVVERALGASGHRVAGAEDVAEALMILGNEDVRLVISDYMMPGTDGIAFLEDLSKTCPGVPRILLTANLSPQVFRRATQEARVDYFMLKPLDPSTLRVVVNALLAVRRQAIAGERRRVTPLPDGPAPESSAGPRSPAWDMDAPTGTWKRPTVARAPGTGSQARGSEPDGHSRRIVSLANLRSLSSHR